ncbi:hypothetical protein GPL15_04355 [Clostridium sp. MCC353]|uniref:hypothetical protein n=1 Tax=Clostridium sp. MCC353 TaxID=2592646 RepID=UPI001C023DAB|nr:hypothetical protein [Clostridium sp. MCC353]MBT9775743.1 hypothetical protein [Clostridium sp. MCC353]
MIGIGGRIPTLRNTRASRTKKDRAVPIHGELFMGLHRSVGTSETDSVFSFCLSFFALEAQVFLRVCIRPQFLSSAADRPSFPFFMAVYGGANDKKDFVIEMMGEFT